MSTGNFKQGAAKMNSC